MGLNVTFQALGADWTLRFDMNAIVRAEEALDRPMAEIGELLGGGEGKSPRMAHLRTVFWAGLGGKIAAEKVGDIITDLGVAEAMALVARAFVAAFPQVAATGDPASEGAPGN